MIVVIGSPVLRRPTSGGPLEVVGLAGGIAVEAARAERTVQLVGKVGDDDAGDAAMIAFSAGRVLHAAVLRDASNATPIVSVPAALAEPTPEALLFGDPDDAETEPIPDGLPLEAADVELAMRYLTDFRVVVIAAPLDPETLAAAFDAARFAGAHVVRVGIGPGHGVGPRQTDGRSDDEAGEASDSARADDALEMTAFEAPPSHEPAFAGMVGRYAAGLDAGRPPDEAFRDATRGTNWERALS